MKGNLMSVLHSGKPENQELYLTWIQCATTNCTKIHEFILSENDEANRTS